MKDGRLDTNNIETVLRSDVRFTRSQLADLFGVYYGTITANIKAIIGSGAVEPNSASTMVKVGKTVLPECYGLEMVVGLAFRLNSPAAEKIRRYIVGRVAAGTGRPGLQIFLSYGAGAVMN